MKIAHISDLHISSTSKRTNIRRARQILAAALKENADHIIITGDIVDLATEKDFKLARKIFKEFNLLDSNYMTLAIGNHDIFGGIAAPEDIVSFPNRCKKIDFKKKTLEFVDYFHETFENVTFGREDHPFPFAKIFQDICIFAFNSVDHYSVIKNPFASNGKIGKKQIEAFKKLTLSPRVSEKRKIVALHHHFNSDICFSTNSNLTLWQKIEKYTLKLRGKKKLLKEFQQVGIELILHGHVHNSDEYYKKELRFSNAGGSLGNKIDETLKINWIEFFKDKIELTIKPIKEIKIIPSNFEIKPAAAPNF